MNPGWLKAAPVPWKTGPLISEDANCVSHVYWRNGTLVDSKSVSWTMNGTVPQIAGHGKIPPGTGPFTFTQCYSTTATADAWDLVGDLLVAAVVYFPGSLAANSVIACSGSAFLNGGWRLSFRNGDPSFLDFYTMDGGGNPVSASANNIPATGIHVLCGGRSGTNMMAKADLMTIGTQAGANAAQDTTRSSYIGVAQNGTLQLNTAGALIYEIYVSTTTPTDAIFISIMNAVKTKVGNTSW